MASMFGLTKSWSHDACVGDAVDVVPPARIEADEVRTERGADLHQLKAGFDLLHEDVHLDGSARQADVSLELVEHIVPQRRFFGGLDFRQVEDKAAALAPQRVMVVHDVECRVHHRRRQAAPARDLDVSIIEVKPPGPEDPCRPIELALPVVDDRPSEEAARPGVHLSGHGFGRPQEEFRASERQLEVALVVERHRVDLTERVLAVEHPAVGA